MFHGTLVGKHWFRSSYRNVSAWQVVRSIGTTIIRLCFFWKRIYGSILSESQNQVINPPTSLDWFIKLVTYISCRTHKLIASNTLWLLLNGENTFLSFQFNSETERIQSVFTILVVQCYPNWGTVHQFSVSLELVNDFSNPYKQFLRVSGKYRDYRKSNNLHV